MPKLKLPWLKVCLHVAALSPFAGLIWDFTQGQLTANPVQAIQLRTGRYTLNFLVLTLACTPVYDIFGFKPARLVRPLLGAYTFAYACLHLLNFVGLDYRFDFGMMWADIGTKRFVFAGFSAFLILMALAVTSTGGWKRRLGKNWRRWHRLIYAAALLAALHFIWLTKADFRAPFIYAGILALLLFVRIPVIARALRIPGRRLKRGAEGEGANEERLKT